MTDYIPKYDSNNAREFIASMLATINLLDKKTYLKRLKTLSDREIEMNIEAIFRETGLDNITQSIFELKYGLPVEEPEKYDSVDICIELNLLMNELKEKTNEGLSKIINSQETKERLKQLVPKFVSLAECVLESIKISFDKEIGEEGAKLILDTAKSQSSFDAPRITLPLYGKNSNVILYFSDFDKILSKHLKPVTKQCFVQEATLNQWNHYEKIKEHYEDDADYLCYIGVERNKEFLRLKFANTGKKLRFEEGDFNTDAVKKIMEKLHDYDEFKKLPENIKKKLESNSKEFLERVPHYRNFDDETKLMLENKIYNTLNQEDTQILEKRLLDYETKFFNTLLNTARFGSTGTILAYNTLNNLNGYMEIWHNYRLDKKGKIICDKLCSKKFEHQLSEGIKPDPIIQKILEDRTQAYICYAIPLESLKNFDKIIGDNLESV